MTDQDRLERRLSAVERSLTGDEQTLDALVEGGELQGRVEGLEAELAAAEERIAELEAATQALRGYVGNVRSVNEDVAQRADAALAAVDRLEEQIQTESRHRDPTRRGASNGRQTPVDGGSVRTEADESMRAPGEQATPSARRGTAPGDGTADGGDCSDGPAEATDPDDEGVLDRLRTRL